MPVYLEATATETEVRLLKGLRKHSPGFAEHCGLVEALAAEPSLKTYHLLPAVRGDLLRKLGRSAEALIEFKRAASLTENGAERKLLHRRAAECAADGMAG